MPTALSRSSDQHIRQGLAAVVALTLAIAAAWHAGFTRLAAHSAIHAAISCEGTPSQSSHQLAAAAPHKIAVTNSGFAQALLVQGRPAQSACAFDLVASCKAGLVALPPPLA